MSAFLVSDAHISAIAHFINVQFANYRTIGDGLPTTDDPQAIGRVLYAANVVSVECRYPDTKGDPVNVWRYNAPAKPVDVVTFLKSLDCLEYQSCEVPNWEGSRAQRIIEWARRGAIGKLPGYDRAPWGID
jgi:hypothetical protein